MIFYKSIERVNADTVCLIVEIDAKAWHAADKGTLYGIDIGNDIYRMTGINTVNPSVDDHGRAYKGIKTIKIYYTDTQWAPMTNVVRFDRAA